MIAGNMEYLCTLIQLGIELSVHLFAPMVLFVASLAAVLVVGFTIAVPVRGFCELIDPR